MTGKHGTSHVISGNSMKEVVSRERNGDVSHKAASPIPPRILKHIPWVNKDQGEWQEKKDVSPTSVWYNEGKSCACAHQYHFTYFLFLGYRLGYRSHTEFSERPHKDTYPEREATGGNRRLSNQFPSQSQGLSGRRWLQWPVRACWRAVWNDFRTANWLQIIDYPDEALQQTQKLLAI